MSNVDHQSTSEKPKPLRNLLMDLKGDLKTKSENSSKSRKKSEECAFCPSDISGNSNSNFDEELSLFLKNTNQNGNLMDFLNTKYLIGYAISEAFSGTDLDAYTLFHLWNTKRTSQQSFALTKSNFNTTDENLELTKRTETQDKDLFVVFFQQLFFSWQSQLELIDRTRPIFKIPPQANSLVHAIEPKTTALVLMAYLYGLNNVKFLGLRNHPNHQTLPGPYMSLLSSNSRADFVTCLEKIKDLVFNKQFSLPEASLGESQYFRNFDGYLNISYFVHELDLIYTYILFNSSCYSNYTEPILLKSFTSWSFGKTSLLLNSYRIRLRYKHLRTAQVLSRFEVVLYLICKIISEFKATPRQAPIDKYLPQNFNFYSFICLVYSYLYAILSIPLELLPWETFVPDKKDESDEKTETSKTELTANKEVTENSTAEESNLNEPDQNDYDEANDNISLTENYNIINMSVHNEFAETAADSTCIENTRRHDNLMTYVIGLVTSEGNWIKKKEKYVDVIDTYKLGLSWYRRPSFSNTLYNTSYKAWPLALYYYNLLIEPCGRAFFVWYWKNIEAWSCSNIWSYRPKFPTRKKSIFSKWTHRMDRRRPLTTDSNLGLKRRVSLRLRDTVAYLFDMELELKRALLYSQG